MRDLTLEWQNGSLARNTIPAEYTPANAKGLQIDRLVQQHTVFFEKTPTITFLNQHDQAVTQYSELPTPILTPEESAAVASVIPTIKSNGQHIVLTRARYDETSNCLLLNALRVDYAFLQALQKNIFPKGSALYQLNVYKTGVIAPPITTDDHTIIMERSQDGLYSSVSGFLEPSVTQGQLLDLIEQTALNESEEELFGNQQAVTLSRPAIAAISFRTTVDPKNPEKKPMPTLEFIAPIALNCDAKALEVIARDNRAKDAHEHTQNFFIANVGAAAYSTAIAQALKGNRSGWFLFNPIIDVIGYQLAKNLQVVPYTIPPLLAQFEVAGAQGTEPTPPPLQHQKTITPTLRC